MTEVYDEEGFLVDPDADADATVVHPPDSAPWEPPEAPRALAHPPADHVEPAFRQPEPERRSPRGDQPGGAPWDPDAEESLVGAMLLSSDARRRGLRGCAADDLYSPELRAIYRAIEALHDSGQSVDEVTVHGWITEHHPDADITRQQIAMIQARTPASASAGTYAETVARYARLRSGMALGADLLNAGRALDFDAFDALAVDVAHRLAPHTIRAESYDLADLWDMSEREREDPSKPWVVPGCLRTNEVIAYTGGEGLGKSTYLRQIGVCVASGLHPFTGLGVGIPDPLPVLFVDLQEDVLDMADEVAKLRRAVDGRYTPGMYRAVSRPEGLDLLSPRGLRTLEGLLDEHHPRLVLVGPVVKMYRAPDGRSRYGEDVVDELTNVLGELMHRYDFGLVLEGHAGNDRSHDEDWRLRGSSVWRSWPAFSHGLKEVSKEPREAEVIRARRDRYTGRCWPTRLFSRPTARLPWSVSDGDYAAILRAMGLHHLLGEATQPDLLGTDEVF